MLQNIREIGIFMILAQAVVHFAPGRQYEKYIKSISGVIILLLFLRPFVQMAGGQWQNPSAVLDGLKEAAGLPDLFADAAAFSESGVETAVIRRMEEEIETRLNRELDADSCLVKRVELSLQEGGGSHEAEPFFTLRVVMGKKAAGSGKIAVDEITVGTPQMGEEESAEVYRLRFAKLLGLEKERVEVRWDGRD